MALKISPQLASDQGRSPELPKQRLPKAKEGRNSDGPLLNSLSCALPGRQVRKIPHVIHSFGVIFVFFA